MELATEERECPSSQQSLSAGTHLVPQGGNDQQRHNHSSTVHGEQDASGHHAPLGRGHRKNCPQYRSRTEASHTACHPEEERFDQAGAVRGTAVQLFAARQQTRRVKPEPEDLQHAKNDHDGGGHGNHHGAMCNEKAPQCPRANAKGHQNYEQPAVKHCPMQCQPRASSYRRGKECRQQQCPTGTEDCKCTPEEGSNQPDIHRSSPASSLRRPRTWT